MKNEIIAYFALASAFFLSVIPFVKNKLMKNFVETELVKNQTRIMVGILLIASMILGLSVSQYFFVFTLFMGTGLIYYGITGFCMLSIIISKISKKNKN